MVGKAEVGGGGATVREEEARSYSARMRGLG